MDLKVGLISSHNTEELKRELEREGIINKQFDHEQIYFVGNLFYLAQDKPLEDFDIIIIRRFAEEFDLEHFAFALNLWTELERKGCWLVNSYDAAMICTDKMETLMKLQQIGIPVPETTVVPTHDYELVLEAFNNLGEDIIIKPLFGSKGRGILRIKDTANLQSVVDLYQDCQKVLYLQEFLSPTKNDHFEDIRIFQAGDEILGSMKRSSKTWITNFSRMGKVKDYQPSEEMKELASKSLKATKAFYAGVDIIETASGPVVIEVNSFPGWQGLQQATGKNIPRLLIQKILSEFRK
ncbi:MAG: RimK family alpha-L-glutamate ligase [Promethearchaeota archaeon]